MLGSPSQNNPHPGNGAREVPLDGTQARGPDEIASGVSPADPAPSGGRDLIDFNSFTGEVIDELRLRPGAFPSTADYLRAVTDTREVLDLFPAFTGANGPYARLREALVKLEDAVATHGVNAVELRRSAYVPERVDWLASECALADFAMRYPLVRDQVLDNRCRAYRQLFTDVMPGVSALDLLVSVEVERAEERAEVRSNLRNLIASIASATGSLDERSTPAEIEQAHAAIRAALVHEDDPRHAPHGAHRSWHEIALEIECELDGRTADGAAVTLETLRRVDAQCRMLAQLILPEESIRGLRIGELRLEGSLPPELSKRIGEIHKELVIDRSRPEPQEGLGRVVSEEEMAEWCHPAGAKLFPITYNGKVEGYYLLYTKSDSFSQEVNETIAHLPPEEELGNRKVGWLQCVGLSKELRKKLAAEGVAPYDFIHRAAMDSAAKEGLDTLYCVVRAGTYANTALKKHMRRGWESTGVFMLTAEGEPYELMRLEIGKGEAIRTAVRNALRSRGIIVPAPSQTTIMSPEEVFDLSSRWAHAHDLQLSIHSSRGPNGLDLYLRIAGRAPVHLRQLRPAQNLWVQGEEQATGSPAPLGEVLDDVLSMAV